MCCSGEVSGNVCSGVPKCSLSEKGTRTALGETIPSCIKLQEAYYKEQAKLFCPLSMPNFYVNQQGGKECTDGLINAAMNAPASSQQRSCPVFSASQDYLNQSTPESCYNQRKLDAVQCFGTDCIKAVRIASGTGTALISVEFTDPNGIRHGSFTRDSLQEYLNRIGGNIAKSFDLDKNIIVTEVAKAVYVDKTMNTADVQL